MDRACSGVALMATMVHVAAVVALVLACVAGVILLVFGLPGTLLILVAAGLYGWATGFAAMTPATLAWLAAMAAAAELFEFLAAGVGGAETKPSRREFWWSIAGAVVGGVLGTPLLFGVGSLGGALAGAFVGAALAAGSLGAPASKAWQAGFAAMRGRLLGFAVKAAIAVAMVTVVLAALV